MGWDLSADTETAMADKMVAAMMTGLALFLMLGGGGGLFSPVNLGADDLMLTPSDLSIEVRGDGGYHLFVRKSEGLGSLILTESTADPAKKAASYSLRAREYNPVNGDEKRMLDGEFLEPETPLYSLIDSTPEPHEEFGEAFHIFIPYTVIYGYPWSRSGEIEVRDGTWLGLRTFERPYGDYRGAFKDNPFILRLNRRQAETVEIDLPHKDRTYNPEVADSMTNLAEKSGGLVYYSSGDDDVVDEISHIIDAVPGDELDIVIALDATASMGDDIAFLQEQLVPLIEEKLSRFRTFRIGVVLYRDYKEAYITKTFPFHEDFDFFQRTLNSFDVAGGRDIPEAVYEAIYAAITEFPWQAGQRLVVQVGDAPPHPEPMGSVDVDLVIAAARERGIAINSIIIPIK